MHRSGRLTRQMGQTYSGSTSASAMCDDPMEMLRRSSTSLSVAVLLANAFLTSSEAPSGAFGVANFGSPVRHKHVLSDKSSHEEFTEYDSSAGKASGKAVNIRNIWMTVQDFR